VRRQSELGAGKKSLREIADITNPMSAPARGGQMLLRLLHRRIRWFLLADEFPAQRLRDFYAANVAQRRANMSLESSLDCNPKGSRIEFKAFVLDSRNEVVGL
jgi:hypothetical protein